MSSNPNTIKDFIFFVDALKYSFVAAKRYFQSIDVALRKIERGSNKKISEDVIIPLISDVWGLIDMGHRIRELIQQAPALKKKSPEIQTFIKATTNVEELRHYIQHLRTGISRLPEISTPLWGVISWVSKSDNNCFTIITGTQIEGVQVHTCAFDNWDKKFAQNLILSVNNTTVELIELSVQIEKLSEFIKSWAIDKGYDYGSKNIPIFTMSAQALAVPEAPE